MWLKETPFIKQASSLRALAVDSWSRTSYYPKIHGPVEAPWGHEIIWKYYGHALFIEMIYTLTRVL